MIFTDSELLRNSRCLSRWRGVRVGGRPIPAPSRKTVGFPKPQGFPRPVAIFLRIPPTDTGQTAEMRYNE